MLSKNLSLREVITSDLAKRRGIKNIPDETQIANLKLLAENVFQPVRDHFKVPIHISSGFRSKILNHSLGGSNTSQHTLGMAIDIDQDGTSITNKQVFDFIKDNLEFCQLINEFNYSWVHVSYDPKNNKKEVLKANKIGIKTLYSKY